MEYICVRTMVWDMIKYVDKIKDMVVFKLWRRRVIRVRMCLIKRRLSG